MTKISELPNTHTNPLRALAELRRKESDRNQDHIWLGIDWRQTAEGISFWLAVEQGQRPLIPAASIEDLRRAGMMPEPEPVIQGFERVDKPSITLEDYARMESEHEAITSPAHYKVCEGLEVVDMIRAVLTPEQFKGYCLGNLIKYRMRAGKKTMSPMEDLGKAHVYEQWLAEMEGGGAMNLDKLFKHLQDEHGLLLLESEKRKIADCLQASPVPELPIESFDADEWLGDKYGIWSHPLFAHKEVSSLMAEFANEVISKLLPRCELTESEYMEREALLEKQRSTTRFFSQEEFDRLKKLSNKMFANAGSPHSA
jgi:hypothetical protein